MTVDLRLEYSRDADSYAGAILRQVQPTRGFLVEQAFEACPFSRMLSYLARAIRLYDVSSVILQRIDIETSSHALDQATIDMLRVDPAQAIRLMHIDPVTVVVRDKTAKRTMRGLLRVGHDTLASAFGDQVYCAVRAGKVECPSCGRWSICSSQLMSCSNDDCGIALSGTLENTDWFSVGTADVLALQSARYFFPRPWNSSGNWIGREELNAMYESFQKERDECFQVNDKSE